MTTLFFLFNFQFSSATPPALTPSIIFIEAPRDLVFVQQV